MLPGPEDQKGETGKGRGMLSGDIGNGITDMKHNGEGISRENTLQGREKRTAFLNAKGRESCYAEVMGRMEEKQRRGRVERREAYWQKEKKALSRQLSRIRHDKQLDKEYQIADLISEKLYELVAGCGEDIKVLESATKVLKTIESIKREIRGILTVEQAQKMYLERGKYLAEREKGLEAGLSGEKADEAHICIEMDETIRQWAK